MNGKNGTNGASAKLKGVLGLLDGAAPEGLQMLPEVLRAAPAVRSGWKTTEFWIVVLAMIAAGLGWLAGVVPAEWAVIAQAIASGLYATSRGLAKRGG